MGRKLVKMLASSYGINADNFRILKGFNGKPYFEDCPLFFNISHTDTMVAAAVGFAPVGIDCEKVRKMNPKVIERVCSPDEFVGISALKGEESDMEFIRLWTYKEAWAKLTGEGLSRSVRDDVKKLMQHRNVFAVSKEFDSIMLTAMEENGTAAEIFIIKDDLRIAVPAET